MIKKSTISLTSTRFGQLRMLAALPLVALAVACESTPTGQGGHGEPPAAAELMDRATGRRLAWTQGTGSTIRWEGALPDLKVGEEIALNVRFLDAQDREVPMGTQLGGAAEFGARARLANGAPAGVVAIRNQANYVEIEATAAGESRLVFMFWMVFHGGQGVPGWETPEISVPVTAR